MFLDACFWILTTPRKYLVKSRLVLFYYFAKLIIACKFNKNIKDIEVFGYRIQFDNPDEFLKIYIDVFIKSQYYFESPSEIRNIVDFGSHIGLSILYFKILYSNARITAVEANPYTYKILVSNIWKNNLSNVKVFNSVVSDETSKKDFYFNKKNKTSWGNSIFKFHDSDNVTISSTKASVFLSEEACQLLKIDLEGSETTVLKEIASSGKLKGISNLIIEFHELGNKENRLSDILKLLEDNKFKYSFNYYLRKQLISIPLYFLTKKYGGKYNFVIFASKQ